MSRAFYHFFLPHPTVLDYFLFPFDPALVPSTDRFLHARSPEWLPKADNTDHPNASLGRPGRNDYDYPIAPYNFRNSESLKPHNNMKTPMTWKPPARPPAKARSRVFWSMIASLILLRLGLSLYYLATHNFFFTLSADDVARIQIALRWETQPAFFPDPTWPPLPFWLGGLLSRLFHTGTASLCVLSILASLAAVPLLAHLCFRILRAEPSLSDHEILFATGTVLAVYVFQPWWIWLGTSMLAEPLYTLLFLASLAAMGKAAGNASLSGALGTVGLGVLATMTRLEGAAWTALLYGLLGWRLYARLSRVEWWSFMLAGLLLTLLFPFLWILAHSSPDQGTLHYFTTLKEGFTSQFGHSAWMTPLHLLRTYVAVSPLCLFLIMTGFVAMWNWSRGVETTREQLTDCLFLIGSYGLTQMAASALGMMPTHNVWRLTVPVYVTMLPFLGVAFAALSSVIPFRSLVLPAAVCVLHLSPSLASPPVFVTPGLHESGTQLREILGPEKGPGRPVLIEVHGWEWITLALLGKGPHWEHVVYDRDRYAPMAIRNDDQRNPSLFAKPLEDIRTFLAQRGVECAIVRSERAKKTMTILGWKEMKRSLYSIYIKPVYLK